jgi:hypothetical protein
MKATHCITPSPGTEISRLIFRYQYLAEGEFHPFISEVGNYFYMGGEANRAISNREEVGEKTVRKIM